MKFLRRLVPCALVILTLVLVFPLFGGCSGDSQSSNRFHELLKLVPSELNDSPELLLLFDYASFQEDFNISLTTTDNQPIAFLDYYKQLSQGIIGIWLMGHEITGYGRWAETGTIKDKYVGYNFTDVEAEIRTGTPPIDVVAAIGRFDPQATWDALNQQDEWLPWVIDAYATEEYRSVTIHTWGNGLEQHLQGRLTPPHVDELGRAKPLAVSEKNLFYAAGTDTIKLMIDASQGKTENLADLPEFAAIANGLADLECYVALIGYESLANGDPEIIETYAGPRLKKFVTFGSGLGRDYRGIYTAIVLYHENPEDADANISLLEERIAETDSIYSQSPWSEIIIDTEIRVEGNVLLAKLYTRSPGIWSSWVYGRDTLLLHEE